jgi:hypothetical protein
VNKFGGFDIILSQMEGVITDGIYVAETLRCYGGSIDCTFSQTYFNTKLKVFRKRVW